MNRSTIGRCQPVVGMIALGCPKNLVDAETILADLATKGYVISADASVCDVLIINTCSFIAPARAEAVTTIREAAAHKRGRCRVLVVTGCLAQLWAGTLRERLPEVDAVVGTGRIDRIGEVVERALNGEHPVEVGKPGGAIGPGPRLLTTPGHYAYLKITEGCSAGCTYCLIPRLRGKQVSRDPDDIVREAGDLAAIGVKELIVIGQDTGAYGRDRGEADALAVLLERLAGVRDIEWIRLLYLNPSGVTPRLARTMGQLPVVCDYVDLPVQHGSNRILRSMGRDGRAAIDAAVERLRTELNDPALRTSLLIGFPGETERDVDELIGMLEEVQFDYAGCFRFSPQPGTPAHGLAERPSPQVAENRIEAITGVQQSIARGRAQRFIGRRLRAVVEQTDGAEAAGRTEVQAPDIDPASIFTGPARDPGTMIEVEVIDAGEWGMLCRQVGR